MIEILKLNLLLTGFLIFGPLLAIYFTFFGDVYTLSIKYPIFTYLTDEWELLFVFGLFWIGFFFMLTFWSALKKYRNKPPHLQWWQKGVVYEIYVRSFNDSNNDGVGDIRGIINKIDYFKSIGVNILWLTPIYPSGGKDGGYDVTSYTDIDPVYGSMKDFDALVTKLHQNDIYIIMDFIPNHTSDQHKWFKESCKNDDPDNPYRDYYVWHPSKDSKNPPNNWVSVFGNSMWEYNQTRQAWYLHQFLPSQPDLNLWSSKVRDELKNAMKFWLDNKKVDGLRIDAVKHLFESKNFENEPVIKTSTSDLLKKELRYEDFDHIHTSNRKETFKLLAEWRRLFDQVSVKSGRIKAMITEADYDPKNLKPYYYYDNQSVSHFPFNFSFSNLRNSAEENERVENTPKELKTMTDLKPANSWDIEFKPKELKRVIVNWNNSLPKKCWSNWVLGNHDIPRIATRIGKSNVNLANAVNLLIGGTSIVYYGEELGMEDLPKSQLDFDKCQDQFGKKHGKDLYANYTRDYQRTPMQWSSEPNAGFSKPTAKTWLPIHPSYMNRNVQAQSTTERSNLNVFKALVNLRKEPAFAWGKLHFIVVNDQVLSFLRDAYDFEPHLVVMNLSCTSTRVNLQKSNQISPKGYVKLYVPGEYRKSGADEKDVDLNEKYKLGAPILTKDVHLKAKDLLILKWNPIS